MRSRTGNVKEKMVRCNIFMGLPKNLDKTGEKMVEWLSGQGIY